MDALLKPQPLYDALEKDAANRQVAYCELFRYELEPVLMDKIRRATNGNYALGNEDFAAQVTAHSGGALRLENRGDHDRCRHPNRGNCLVGRKIRGLSPVVVIYG